MKFIATNANNTGSNVTAAIKVVAADIARDSAIYTVTVTPTPPAVSVTPVSGTVTINRGEVKTSTFTIQNTGGGSTSYTYNVACPTVVTNCTASSSAGTALSGQTGTLGPNATFQVAVTYTGAATGSGPLTLGAADNVNSGVSSVGQVGVTVASTDPVTVVARAPGLDGSVARDACLDMPLGKGASYECGDLRIAYPLPAMTTMNKTRQPTLLYLSSHANATSEIFVDIAMRGPTPDSIVPKLTISGKAPITYPRIAWDRSTPTDAVRRITVPVDGQAMALTTGLYQFTLEVSATSGGVTVQASDTGSVTIVNRINSPFGRGWWLEGLEKLVFLSNNNVLWVGGDGSTRVYTQAQGSGTPADPRIYTVRSVLNRPDTLQYVQTSLTINGSTYTRRLPNGARTEFNGLGNHVRTIDSQGHQTNFTYFTSGRLQSIDLPTPNGVAAVYYSFNYTSADETGWPRLESIHLAGQGVADQPTYLTALPTGWLSNIQFLQPSDTGYASSGAVTQFAYSPDLNTSATSRDLVTVVDPDSHSLSIAWDQHKLQQSAIAMTDSADNIVTKFCPAETRARATCSTSAELLANAVTFIQGPRPNMPDDMTFYVNRFGAPDTVVNALGQRTRFVRSQTFPLVATSIVKPNGLTTNITINPQRGLPDVVTVVNPLGPTYPGNAVTRYTWHPYWNLPLTVTTPTNEITTFTYNDTIPFRRTQSDGRGTTTFDHNLSWQVQSITPPANGSGSTGTPIRIDYDALGNLATVTSQLGIPQQTDRDAIGRITKQSSPIDPLGKFVRRIGFAYYASGLVYQQADTGPALGPTVPLEYLTTKHSYYKSGLPKSVTQIFSGGSIKPYTEWTYDNAGRRVTEESFDNAPALGITPVSNGGKEITGYDPAGNVVSRTPKVRPGIFSGAITMQYDVLNRMSSRTVLGVTIPKKTDGKVPALLGYDNGSGSNTNYINDYLRDGGKTAAFFQSPYPQYPNAPNGAYLTQSELATFTYDDVTNDLLTATNQEGRVTRTYYPNGLIETENQELGTTANPADFSKHSYTLQYIYDVSGRRRELVHPAQLRTGASRDRTTWTYDPVTGALESVTDVLGNRIAYSYYDDGSVSNIAHGASSGIGETMLYDADGRMVQNAVGNGSSSPYRWQNTSQTTYLRNESLSYDQRDKLTQVQSLSGLYTQRNLSYSGLGYLIRSEFTGDWATRVGSMNFTRFSRHLQRLDRDSGQEVRREETRTEGVYRGVPARGGAAG